jgi:hypothetical protein
MNGDSLGCLFLINPSVFSKVDAIIYLHPIIPFALLDHKIFQIIWLSNLLTLSVPDDCSSINAHIALCFCFVCPRLVSYVTNVASFFGLSMFDCPFGFL